MNVVSTVLGITIKIVVAVLIVLKELGLSLLRAIVTGLKMAMTEAPKVAAQVREGATDAGLPDQVNNLTTKANEFISRINDWANSHDKDTSSKEVVVYVEQDAA